MTTREQDLAIREAAQNASSRDYFGARSRDFDTERSRRVFESGFFRGYDAATAPLLARIAELESELTRPLSSEVSTLLAERAQLLAENAELKKDAEPVAWYEHNPDLDAWFLAYSKNPNNSIKSRPLVFGDAAIKGTP